MHNIHCKEKQLLGNHIIKPKGVYYIHEEDEKD
jgi:hypothetical protein